MSLTSAQQQAVDARGNTLVMAGAGTGKTHTLVARVFSLLEGNPPVSLDEILMVTFTDAAAAEMRERISRQCKKDLGESLAQIQRNATDSDKARTHRLRSEALLRWQERVALLDTAHIGTLHSFCLKLVRQHFYQLQLDPQLIVMPAEDASLLAEETLQALLEKHYAADTEAAKAVKSLIQVEGRGWDKPIRHLVLRLHHYTQTRPDPRGWFAQQLNLFTSTEPTQWESWFVHATDEWFKPWGPILQDLAADGNDLAAKCAQLLHLPHSPAPIRLPFQAIVGLSNTYEYPRGKKTAWFKPLEKFFKEASFLRSLSADPASSAPTPLAQDWAWVRGHMRAMLELAQQFADEFAVAKRELGMLDFHDLEQFALQLLWDPETNRPTPTALQWRQKLRFVFVDEYQDINAAQDKIVEALSREGSEANRFLVGDVKQSIYRFRLANPHIFQRYAETWRGTLGQTIPLTGNFRSREGILNTVNSLFSAIMRRDLGGVEYDQQAMLQFGAPEERMALAASADTEPPVELHLRIKGGRSTSESPEADGAAQLDDALELDEAEKEARLVALRLHEIRANGHKVWDESLKTFRPVEWSDMAILLRSPSGKVESYAKEFSRLGIPLTVERGGFYESIEVTDLLSLLQMLDNPLQDLPVLAVLRSPLVGLSLNELATIRLAAPRTRFWTALLRWEEAQSSTLKGQTGSEQASSPPTPDSAPAHALHRSSLIPYPLSLIPPSYLAPLTSHLFKVSLFLSRFRRWRRLSRQTSLSRCLEAVLSETHYAEWLLTQPRGQQRRANVERLVALAQQFDQFQRQGLFRFLRFIEAQQEAETEPEVAAVADENSVRLMSIHQSKGLEFPVVVVADLGKGFNTSDLHAPIILDEEYGLCPKVKPPHIGQRYPSLPHWLASRRQHRELLGEELRLLYVAMTRARDLLLLTATVSEKQFETAWRNPAPPAKADLTSACCFSDWLAPWFAINASPSSDDSQGHFGNLRWHLHSDTDLLQPPAAPNAPVEPAPLTSDPETWQRLQTKLSWAYPFAASTRQPAKSSVSALRRAAADPDELITSSLDFRPAQRSSTDIGLAHHAFLQLLPLKQIGNSSELKRQASLLEKAGSLTPDQTALLDFENLAAFWNSAIGRQIRGASEFVHRELPFTARFSPLELQSITGAPSEDALASEFVIVQGVADLVVLRPNELWLLDFKTDHLSLKEIPDRAKQYEPQLKLYALALSRIYRRPVSHCWLYFLSCRKAVEIPSLEPITLNASSTPR